MKSILSEQREADEELCERLDYCAQWCDEGVFPIKKAATRIRALSADLQEACHERDGLLAKVERAGKHQPSDPTKRMARILGAVWVERDFPPGEKP